MLIDFDDFNHFNMVIEALSNVLGMVFNHKDLYKYM